MSILLHARFWIGFALALALLSLTGAGLAWLIVPTPPVYHRTTFFEFPLPADWSCDMEGTETVCYPAGPPPYVATIIFTAKWRASYDTREAYVEHLSKPHKWRTPEGEEIVPDVLYVRDTILGGHDWVDSRHRNAELERFVTRYMATVTADIGVLVTYSIHQNHIDTYDPALSRAVEGLDIYQQATAIASPGRQD
jgi:hypothetical protein